MAHLLGYARVSTIEQNPDLQVDELAAAGCWKIWTDHASGALDRRPQLDAVLEPPAAGGHVGGVVAGPARPVAAHLIDVVAALEAREVRFRSLRENIDTTTAGGRLVFHLFGALAQLSAGDHPGPDGGRADRGSGPRPGRRSPVQAVR